jgi:superfamily I DNA and/or RNA helicase
VILVLGASADASRGSRNWAGGAPNILNVAVTRAKKALYIVGRHEAWRTAGVFAHAAAVLPVLSLES